MFQAPPGMVSNSKTLKLRNFTYFLTSLLMLAFSSTNGQDWAPIGATWNYSAFNFGTPVIDVSSVTSVGDTVIAGKSCRVLSYNNPSFCSWMSPNFIHTDSNRVYYYNESNAQFNLLYDFNAGQGDSWELDSGVDTFVFTIYVDSVDSITINNVKLKIMHIRSLDPMSDFSGIAIERIGLMLYLFPQIGVCDPQVSPLRCYEDSVIGLYETGVAPTCDSMYVSLAEAPAISSNLVNVYPNPFDKELIISCPELGGEKTILILSDVLGRPLVRSEYQVDPSGQMVLSGLENMASGSYFLRIQSALGYAACMVVKKQP